MSEIITVNDTVGVIEVGDEFGTVVESFETFTEAIHIATSELVGPQGPPGLQGNIGPAGPAGPVGPFAPTFRMEFASPSDTWTVVHNLGVFPVVDLYDFDGYEIGGDVQMPDRNTVVVLFDVPVAGIAILKA